MRPKDTLVDVLSLFSPASVGEPYVEVALQHVANPHATHIHRPAKNGFAIGSHDDE